MFNLPEVLTLIIGFLLALIFIDGVRRSLRGRANSLKVELMDSSEVSGRDFQEEWLDNYEGDKNLIDPKSSEDVEEVQDNPGALPESKAFQSSHQLLIINHSTKINETFSYASLAIALKFDTFTFDSQGYFVITDQAGRSLFSILNGKKPGTFMDGVQSSDIAFVFDPSSVENPIEVLDQMYLLSLKFSEVFHSEILDENRNLLTKQMFDHMRHQAQEFQRQQLAGIN